MSDLPQKPAIPEFHVSSGETVKFSKTVSESDIYLFAGITGDFAPHHVNEEYMRASPFGQRIAHGALLVGFMSATAAMMIARCVERGVEETPVSLGFDRIRFVKPVFIGDTVTVVYTIGTIDHEKRRTTAKIEISNQRGEVVAVGDHILKWVSRGTWKSST
ncbi:MAG: MaoC family dehydratase [Verrucomicrobia bacterium]|nr:MaoC family dehydratase [Verrucomicrobiota bacterium]